MKSVDSGRSWAARPEIIVPDFKEEVLEHQVQENTIIQGKQSINKVIMKKIIKTIKQICFKVSILVCTIKINNSHLKISKSTHLFHPTMN